MLSPMNIASSLSHQSGVVPAGKCIPREAMPQLDLASYSDLVEWVKTKGVLLVPRAIEPARCHSLQCMSRHPRSVSLRTLQKPVLIASDFAVVDGNHRWWHQLHNRDDVHHLMPVLQFSVPFREAVDLMFQFPATYSYADGNFHPKKWE